MLTRIRINPIVIAAVLFAMVATAYFGVLIAHGEVNFQEQTTPDSYQLFTFLTATTTTATSTNITGGGGYFKILGATDVIFYFSRGDTKGTGNSGSTQFKVQVTPDGINWFDYNELGAVNISQTADQFYTRVGSSTISAATSTNMFAMEDIDYYGVRCIAVRTTDGEASCKAAAHF